VDDRERDVVNHPDRPLPSRHLTPAVAAVLYFTFLGLALFSTRHYVSQDFAFWYYALFVLSVSYGLLVDCLPSLKAPYVALASSVPILIVAAWYPHEKKLYLIAGAVFLLTIGREICMDIKDRAGDAISFMHRFRPTRLAAAAFSLEASGLVLLAAQIRGLGGIVVLLAMIFLLALSSVYWFKFANYKWAIILMKFQFLVGAYFLT
jgi:hypothetical protein